MIELPTSSGNNIIKLETLEIKGSNWEHVVGVSLSGEKWKDLETETIPIWELP